MPILTNSSCLSDINECNEGRHSCVENSTCVNSFGSYSCVCNVGLVGNGKVNCLGKLTWNSVSKKELLYDTMLFAEAGDLCPDDMMIDVVLILQTDDEGSLGVLRNFASYLTSKIYISEDQVQVSIRLFLFIRSFYGLEYI